MFSDATHFHIKYRLVVYLVDWDFFIMNEGSSMFVLLSIILGIISSSMLSYSVDLFRAALYKLSLELSKISFSKVTLLKHKCTRATRMQRQAIMLSSCVMPNPPDLINPSIRTCNCAQTLSLKRNFVDRNMLSFMRLYIGSIIAFALFTVKQNEKQFFGGKNSFFYRN